MNSPTKPPVPPAASGPRPRYGLLSLLLVMFVFCMMGAAGRYLMLALREGTSPKAVFVIFTLAAPMLLVVVLNIIRLLVRWIGYWRGR